MFADLSITPLVGFCRVNMPLLAHRLHQLFGERHANSINGFALSPMDDSPEEVMRTRKNGVNVRGLLCVRGVSAEECLPDQMFSCRHHP